MVQVKIHFHTFGDGTFGIRMASKRLSRQAKWSNLFTTQKSWDLRTLVAVKPEFKKNSNFILNNSKGLGYWLWKPYVLRAALDSANEGEVVVLLDAGCQLNLNPESLDRFNEYVQMVQGSGSIFMQLRDGDFGISTLSEQSWTKNKTLEYLDPQRIHRHSNQIQSGIIFVVKNSRTSDLVDKWIELTEKDNYSLLLSPTNLIEESIFFVEHRWEQSILSLLVKSQGFNHIHDETYFGPSWENGYSFPVWATRNRSGGDAIRRNLVDLAFLFVAKIERGLIVRNSHYRKFLKRSIQSSMLGK